MSTDKEVIHRNIKGHFWVLYRDLQTHERHTHTYTQRSFFFSLIQTLVCVNPQTCVCVCVCESHQQIPSRENIQNLILSKKLLTFRHHHHFYKTWGQMSEVILCHPHFCCCSLPASRAPDQTSLPPPPHEPGAE